MKISAFRLLSVLFFAGTLLSAGEGGLKEFKLTKEYRPQRQYQGKVDYSNTAIVSFEEKGRLAYVAPVGKYVESDVFDLNGKVVHEGDLLAKQDTAIPENNLKLAEIKLKEAEITLIEKEQTYLRDKKLFDKNAVSTKQFLESQLIYETALFDKQKALLEVGRCKRVVEACYFRAPFNGVVEEVYQLAGAAVDVAHRVLKISAVSPIKITIKLPEDITQQLDQTTEVLVYPVDSITPVLGWFNDRHMGAGSLDCFVENPRLPVGTLTEAESKLPIVDNLSVIASERLKWNPNLLWINAPALLKDKDGYFVWKLKGLKATDIKKQLKRVNTIEKVRVKALDFEIFRGIYRLRGIEKSSELDVQDILAEVVPESVKTGDRVVYRTTRRLFRPGEQVTVVLCPAAEPSGFYVPVNAVRRDSSTDDFFVIVNRNGKAHFQPVSLHEKQGTDVRVESTSLQSGMKLIYGDGMDKVENNSELPKID